MKVTPRVKDCHPRKSQMAVDKAAIMCLSRVYSYYFKCNIPLFYVYPALTRYLSILLLNILTLLACTHSSDNVFHTLMVLCEKENFLTSNLLCFFTRVKLWPLPSTISRSSPVPAFFLPSLTAVSGSGMYNR